MATKQDVLDVLDYLASAYNYKDLDDKAIRAWSATFGRIPRLWLARCAMKWVEAEKWMPKISEMSYSVHEKMGGMDGNKVLLWSPPRHPRDEAAMWLCFKRGIGPDELTIADLTKLPMSEEESEVQYA